MEGYVRLLLGLVAVALGVAFFVVKCKAVGRDRIWNGLPNRQWNGPKDVHWGRTKRDTLAYRIALYEMRIRHYLSTASAFGAGGLVAFGFLYFALQLGSWLEFSLPDAATGYEALGLLLFNALKLIPLAVLIGVGAVVTFWSFWVSFALSYAYLVFGSMIHVPLFVHWLMTGEYFGGWLEPEHVWIALVLTAVNVLSSDLGDLAVMGIDAALDA